jgi:hypothetical protein
MLWSLRRNRSRPYSGEYCSSRRSKHMSIHSYSGNGCDAHAYTTRVSHPQCPHVSPLSASVEHPTFLPMDQSGVARNTKEDPRVRSMAPRLDGGGIINPSHWEAFEEPTSQREHCACELERTDALIPSSKDGAA